MPLYPYKSDSTHRTLFDTYGICHIYSVIVLFVQNLKDDPKDEYLKLLRATIKCLTSPERYFEKVLRLAINRVGTDEWALTRVVTTRAEVDLQHVKEEYHKRNSVPLDRAIAGDTSGDYEKMLLALTGHGDL